MAERLENDGIIVFGIMEDASQTVTHARVQKTGDTAIVVELTSSVTAAVGERLRIISGAIDFVYPDGEFPQGHMGDVIAAYYADGQSFNIDLMTDDSTVVSDAGYSQQAHTAWTLTTEAD